MIPADGLFVETPCPFCHAFVDVNAPDVYQQVIGWVKPRLKKGSDRLLRSPGGPNQITLREPLLLWAHGKCVEREKRERRLR